MKEYFVFEAGGPAHVFLPDGKLIRVDPQDAASIVDWVNDWDQKCIWSQMVYRDKLHSQKLSSIAFCGVFGMMALHAVIQTATRLHKASYESLDWLLYLSFGITFLFSIGGIFLNLRSISRCRQQIGAIKQDFLDRSIRSPEHPNCRVILPDEEQET